MANQIMRITLKAYDHKLIDKAAAQIVDTVKKTGAKVSGPVPMPTKIEKITILRAVHKYKDSREQFEQRTHKRLIDVVAPTQKTIDALQKIDLSAGVFIDVKMKQGDKSYFFRGFYHLHPCVIDMPEQVTTCTSIDAVYEP